MRKRTVFLVSSLALVAVLFTGAIVASNMGFKLNYTLTAAGGSSLTGTNTLALPYNRQTGVDTAKKLMDDINFTNVAEVSRFLEVSDSFETYTGRKGSPGPDFSLTTGEAHFVKMSANENYIVTGSHDPSASVPLDIAGGGSATGTNFFSVPYHTTSGTAKALMDDIGFANVAEVSRFLTASDSFETYTGRKGSPGADFTLSPGEGYFVKMQSATVNYIPSHY